jgi:hypothetical protein
VGRLDENLRIKERIEEREKEIEKSKKKGNWPFYRDINGLY